MSQGRYDEALALLANDHSPRAGFLRGVCHHRTGGPAIAETEYTAALAAGFDPFNVLLHRGVLFAWTNRYEQAHHDFTQAHALDPAHLQAKAYLDQSAIVVEGIARSRRFGELHKGPLLRRDEARYLYFAPTHCPQLDPLWLETCSVPQSTQFMIDCLPAIRKLTAGWPYNKVMEVIDVGTATGAGAALLARFYSAGFFGFPMQVEGIDMSPQNQVYARAVFPELHYEVGDFFDYRPGHQWDLVYCSHTIEHIWDPWPWIERVRLRARKWAMFYCPFEEKQLLPGHRLSFTRPMIDALNPIHVEIIDSPAWRNPVDEISRAVLFVLPGTEA